MSLRIRECRSERGQAMVIVLAVAALISAALIGVLLSSTTDLRIATAFVRTAEADAAADAGLSRALVDLAALPTWTPVLDGSTTSGFTDGAAGGVRSVPGGVFVDLDLALSQATCGHSPPCSDADRTATTLARPWGLNNPRWRLFAWGSLNALLPVSAAASSPPGAAYIAVLAADDPAESDGNPDRDEDPPGAGAGLLRLRAEAYGPAGVRRVAEALLARPPTGAGVRVLRWTHTGGG